MCMVNGFEATGMKSRKGNNPTSKFQWLLFSERQLHSGEWWSRVATLKSTPGMYHEIPFHCSITMGYSIDIICHFAVLSLTGINECLSTEPVASYNYHYLYYLPLQVMIQHEWRGNESACTAHSLMYCMATDKWYLHPLQVILHHDWKLSTHLCIVWLQTSDIVQSYVNIIFLYFILVLYKIMYI